MVGTAVSSVRAELRIQGVAETIAQQAHAEDGQRERARAKQYYPRRGLKEDPAVVEHGALPRCGRGTPSPRKDRVASVHTAFTKLSETCTIARARQLGTCAATRCSRRGRPPHAWRHTGSSADGGRHGRAGLRTSRADDPRSWCTSPSPPRAGTPPPTPAPGRSQRSDARCRGGVP